MGVEEPRLIRLDSDEPWEYVLPEGETRIGRSRGNAICLRETTVSRFHCYLVREGAAVRVFEGKCKNPARLNGDPVNGQRLRTGQILQVGTAEFVFQGAVEAGAPAGDAPPAAAPPLPDPAPISAPLPAPAPVPTHRAPAPLERRPSPASFRRRRRTRSREPAVVGALVLILATPVFVWLVVSGPSLLGKKDAALPPATDPRAADLASEIEARIAAIERTRAAEGELASAQSAKKIEDLSAQLADLHSELERLRARSAPGGAEAPRSVAIPEPAAPRIPDPPGKLHGKFSIPEDGPDDRAKEPTTVVVTRRPASVRLKPQEVREIEERLRRQVEDYATHTVTAALMRSDLDQLAAAEGKEAPAALLALEKLARQLLRETDASIDLNRKRRDVLLEKARVSAPSAPAAGAPKAPKGYGDSKAAGSGTETDQRWLDLFAKAMEIHARHRTHLVPLRIAILEAMSRVASPDGLDALRARVLVDDDEDLTLAIAGAFEAAGWKESIPALCRRFSAARTDRVRAGLRKTLTALVGEDLGERSGPWLEWWEKRR